MSNESDSYGHHNNSLDVTSEIGHNSGQAANSAAVTGVSDLSASFLRAYFDAGIIGMVIVAPDKTLVDFNDAYCEMLGYSRAEIAAKSWVDYTHPDDLDIGSVERSKVFAGEIDGYGCEKRFFHKDGHVVHVSISAKCMRDTDGKVQNFISFVKDNTGRKQEEERLKVYEQIINTYQYPMFFVDKHYAYQAANQAFLDTFGKTMAEVIDHTIEQVLGKEHFEQFSKPNIDMCLAGETVAFQAWYPDRGNGERYIDVSYIPYRNENGMVCGVVVATHDITQLQQTQMLQAQNERRLREVQRIANVGYWERDISAGTLFLSDEIYDMFGIDAADFDGTRESLARYFHPEDMDEALRHYDNTVYSPDGRFSFGHRIVRPGGEVRYLKVQGEVTYISDGKPRHILGATIDITDSKHIEEELRKNEFRLQEAQRIAHIGLWEWDMFKDELYWSKELYAIAGKEPGSFTPTNMSVIELIAVEDRQQVQESFRKTMHEGVPYDIEHRFILDNGEIRYVHAQGGLVRDDRGRPLRIIGTLIDFTARKLNELALQKNDWQLREAQRIGGLGFWEWKLDEERVYWSDVLYEMTGYKRSEFEPTARNIMQHIHPDDLDSVTASFRTAIKEHQPYITEHRFIRSNGEIRHHLISGEIMPDADGKTAVMLGTSLDITAIKQREQQLNEAQRIGKLGFWEWDMVKDKIFWSDQLLEMSGYVHTNFTPTNESIMDHIHPEDRETVRSCVRKALRENQSYESEHRYIRADGEIRFHRITGEVRRDRDGKPVSMLGTSMDITEMKMAELELKQHRDHLEDLVAHRTAELKAAQMELVKSERLATLGKLTATVSHELRNPLGAASLALYTLKKFINVNNPVLVDTFHRLERNVRRCDNIIDELLDFTRIGNFELQPMHLDAWLQELVEEQRLPDGVSIELEFNLGNAFIMMDSDRLRRALINVIDNGCQAMASSDDPNAIMPGARLKISTRMTKYRIEIIVSDLGKGIPEDVMPNIFEPLYSTKNFGVGLGLPTVKQIMEQHGGGIEVTSRMNKGTDVLLSLPLTLMIKKVAS